jgi:hypothetical protein
MSSREVLKNCVCLLKAEMTFQVRVESVRQGKAPMEGNGKDKDIKVATEAACVELVNKLASDYEAVKLEMRLEKQAKRKEQLLKMPDTGFHPIWVPTLTLKLKHGRVSQVSQVGLSLFVTKILALADAAPRPLVVGMDTEGQNATKERPFAHAHFMQLAAGSDNECVVFRTTKANLEIALALFIKSKIIIAVAGKNEDCAMLKKIFSPDDNLVWMERIADVQLLGMKEMGLESAPKLEAMVSHMWEAEPPLMKFLHDEGKDTREKVYACFDDDTKEALGADMLLYAALDAMAAKELYEYFSSLAPAESTEATKASAASAPLDLRQGPVDGGLDLRPVLCVTCGRRHPSRWCRCANYYILPYDYIPSRCCACGRELHD